jgi:hypothetical protein
VIGDHRGNVVVIKSVSDHGRLRLLGVVTVLALVTAGCGGGGGAPAASPAVPTAPASGTLKTGSTEANRTAAVCSSWVDSDAAAAEVLLTKDLSSATADQLQATVKEFWSRQEPILASMQQQGGLFSGNSH